MQHLNTARGYPIAVIIPCYKVTQHILGVINSIGPECEKIYAVDDHCPDGSGAYIEQHCKDPRVTVIYNQINLGVGGAVMTGYRRAIDEGAVVMVKIDGDGQMDPDLLPQFVAPIFAGEADYTKGNRFYDLSLIGSMPAIRLFGNAVLSFMTKLSTGYWDLFDPTNGYTAIHADVAKLLPFDKISNRYFFETDLLFRLGTIRAVVVDIPMHAQYGEEVSNLQVSKILGEFLKKHVRNFAKRIFYSYYLRDFSVASLELIAGSLLLSFGLIYGSYHWLQSSAAGLATPAGTVMVAALPVISGVQFLLAFLGYDIANTPRRVLSTVLGSRFIHSKNLSWPTKSSIIEP